MANFSRHKYILLFMTILSAVLVLRLFALTVVENKKWSAYADDMTTKSVYETAPRGDILDRNGKVLATTKAGVRVYPEGSFAAHTIGYLGRISEEEREEYVDEKGYRI